MFLESGQNPRKKAFKGVHFLLKLLGNASNFIKIELHETILQKKDRLISLLLASYIFKF